MGVLLTEDLQPGMVLDEDVKNLNGQLLLKKGSSIASHDLIVFRQWGITHASVVGVTRGEMDEKFYSQFDAALLTRARSTLNRRFKLNDLSHPAMAELYRIAFKRTMERIVGEANHD